MVALLFGCGPVSIEGDRRVIKSASGYQTVSMLDGGRTGLYYDWGERLGQARPNARRVVLLGMGGGEMLRSARRALPAAHLVGVELEPEVVTAAIGEFRILEVANQVEVSDASDYLDRQSAGAIDLLMVDIFDDSLLPARFARRVFYRECLRVMAPDGLLGQNVWPPEMAPAIAREMTAAGFRRVAQHQVLEGNVMVVAEP